MPTYPANPTFISGFYNSKKVNGVDDRVYNADEMTLPYHAIFSDGVKPNEDGTLGTDLQVQAVNGLTIKVAPGEGLFGKKYFWNKSIYNITLDTPGGAVRYDCVIVRADNNDDVRATSIYIKSLTYYPTNSDLTRDGSVNEYCLGVVTVPAFASSVTQSNITDTRLNASLCGIITGVYNRVDGEAITAQWNAAFNEWFEDVKDKLVANATLVHSYFNTYTTVSANEQQIPIGISQYDMNLDILNVLIEGRAAIENEDYTILNNDYIRLTLSLPVAGTQVQFQVLKSIDGSNAESVVSEVVELRRDVDEINKELEYHYYCNGATDNVYLSNIAEYFLTGGTDYGAKRLVVHGTFGARSPFSGSGTSSSPYVWLKLGQGTTTNRKIIVDFSDCSALNINCTSGTYNIVFYGMEVNIIGANVIATNGAYIYMFSTPTNIVANAENCRFWITASNGGIIAKSGTFKNCRVSLTITGGAAYCFDVGNAGLLRLFGGEYYAYSGSSSYESAIVRVAASQTEAVAITYGINCPTVARGGYNQSHAINALSNSAKCSFTDTITELTITATGQNVRGTLAISKPGMM